MKSTIIKIAAIFLFSPFSQAQTQSDEWNLVANSRDNYYGVAMANGQIGIVTDATPLKTKEIILNGVYDGSPENGISRIVRGIEFLNLRLVINGEEVTASNIDKWEQVVAMKEGTSTTSFRFKDVAAIEYTILANRALPFSAMAIVKITPLKDIEMTAANYMTVPEELKQADVNLLAYPLHIITEKEQIKKDLEYYAYKIDKKDGLAMASGVLSVLYARLGDRDKAYEYFVKSYLPNSRPPFGVFSESANSNNPYFATGAGAMLQAVIYGFGGVEQTDKGLQFNKGILPKKWKSLKIIGIGTDERTITVN